MAPTARNFSMWSYHLRMLDALPPRPAPDLSDAAALARWQSRVRARLDSLVGGTRPHGDLALEIGPVHPVPGDEGFQRRRAVFRSEEHLDTPAWLLVPDGAPAPRPAVVAIHGHGPDPWLYDAGKDLVCGPPPADPAAAAAVRAQCPAFGADLARAGFVVLAPDLRGFGERWDRWPEGHAMCDIELSQHLVRHALPLGGQLRDLRAALDVLGGLDDWVDAGRLGAVGFSYGGTLALFLAALDDRVRAAAVSGAFSDPRAAARVPANVCGAQVVPGLAADLDHVQVAAAVAPRALLVENGSDDVLWPAGPAQLASVAVGDAYRVAGAPDRFRARTFDGPHRWDGTGVVPFLSTHLGPS